jgi:hypothetical protein
MIKAHYIQESIVLFRNPQKKVTIQELYFEEAFDFSNKK